MLKPCFLSDEYLVSDEGFVLSKRGKRLKPSKNHHGYYIVNLMIDGKRVGVAVHTLVARAFCSGYKKGLTVNHIDGNKENNKAENLEWITETENLRHAIKVLKRGPIGSNNPWAKKVSMINKCTKEVLRTFDCCMYAAKFLEPLPDEKRLRVVEQNITRAARGVRKSYKGYIWKY